LQNSEIAEFHDTLSASQAGGGIEILKFMEF